jgi:hypothetical protein
MKVQRLIEKYKKLEGVWDAEGAELARQIFLQDLEQLDEPEKPVVPPVVSVWYQINKDNLYKNIAYLCANWVKSTTDDTLFDWMSNTDNFIEILVNMHQFGYEVEKEKRYTVVMKETKQPLYYNAGDKKLFFSMGGLATNFTQKQLEEAGFGWVFDCPGIEIEEVEE